ncbi:MAG TPA: hypothetical protein PK829_10995, partial [Promineifilum sp.]|nr:hypothetical protein [Promineifilum sp.]
MDSVRLLDLLEGALSEAEMTALAGALAVAFAAFPGATKRERTGEFLGYVQRQGRSAGLAEALVALRPDLATAVAHLYADNDAQLAWLDQISGHASGHAAPTMSSAVTWRWPADDPGNTREFPLQGDGPDKAVPRPWDPADTRQFPPEKDAPPAAPPNPYLLGRAVSDEAMFFGRDAEQARVQEWLAAGAHVALVGARLFGASSLLRHAARHVVAPWLPAAVDMKEPSVRTRPGLLNAVWGQWWSSVKPSSAAPVNTLAEFVTAARKLNAAGFRPLLFLDELEQLAWRPAVFDDAFFDAWLALGREGAVTFVVTSHVAPAELFAQSGYTSRFYELFRQLDVGLLDADAARALLTIPIERAGLTVPASAAERLLALAGPQPFFLQLAGLYLYEALAAEPAAPEAVERHFTAAAAPYWRELWETLSPLAQSAYPVTATPGPR